MPSEVEIKFVLSDGSGAARAVSRKLRAAGFHMLTRRTQEMNTLYDLTGHPLRARGEVLRLRHYGVRWTLTHKTKGTAGRHKIRQESETTVVNGEQMDAILSALGYQPSFRYEKFRTEFTSPDGKGHVVLDETPIGNFGEIEGPARWIDRTAKLLELTPADYITESYAALFFAWKQRTGSGAEEMTFAAVKGCGIPAKRTAAQTSAHKKKKPR